jgi:hypothetical protein
MKEGAQVTPAAPKIVAGIKSILSAEAVLTWARYPQKSQITSAHLKFGGSRRRVPLRLQRAQLQRFTTRASPSLPSSCLGAVIEVRLCPSLSLPPREGSTECEGSSGLARPQHNRAYWFLDRSTRNSAHRAIGHHSTEHDNRSERSWPPTGPFAICHRLSRPYPSRRLRQGSRQPCRSTDCRFCF